MKKIIYGLWVLFIAMNFSACDRGGDDDPIHIHKDEYTLEDQSVIGVQVQKYIENTPSLFPSLDRSTHVELYNYFNTLVKTLTNTTAIESRDAFDWELTILKDDQTRSAFSAPGGKIFIYTGLLKFISGENELMSILAHEISYVESGKVMKNLQAKYSEDDFFLGDILLGKQVEGMDQLCMTLKNMTYQKEEVIEADNFSIDLMCPFQYNALGIKTIIDHAAQSTTEVLWLEVRPGDAARLKNIESRAEDCGDEEDPTFAERYESFKEKLP